MSNNDDVYSKFIFMTNNKYKYIENIKHGYNDIFLVKSNKQFSVVKRCKINQPQSSFKSIISMLTSISHQSLINLQEYHIDDDYYYLVFPYICGFDMFNANIDYDLSVLINIARQIIDGIAHMHNNNFIHGDIKPENIMLVGKSIKKFEDSDSDEESCDQEFLQNLVLSDTESNTTLNTIGDEIIVKIIDFDYCIDLTNVEFAKKSGSIDYIAPEIVLQESNIDLKATDIYSLGVTLYYLFNKKLLPFDFVDVNKLEYRIRNVNPIASNCSNIKLDQMIMKMIAREPLQRPNILQVGELFVEL